MSVRLGLFNLVFRAVLKPVLTRLSDPGKVRRGFEVLCAGLPVTP